MKYTKHQEGRNYRGLEVAGVELWENYIVSLGPGSLLVLPDNHPQTNKGNNQIDTE